MYIVIRREGITSIDKTRTMKNTNLQPDLKSTYKVDDYDIHFDAKTWSWIAVNRWGFGVDSDMDLSELISRLQES